jgi:N-acyl-D-aspartate/D-glutamate deacylase
MDERAITENEASPEDIVQMAELVQEGIEAGALGFSTSRVIFHRAKSGELVPGTMAGENELSAIFEAMARASGTAVFEAAADISTDEEFALFKRLSKKTGLPVSLAMLQENEAPERWRTILQRIQEARADGANMRAQITVRYVGLMFNWRGSLHPFLGKPAWLEIAALAWEDQLERLRDPAFRERMISEPSDFGDEGAVANLQGLLEAYDTMFATDGDIDYEPDPATTIGARARVSDVQPLELVYDALMANDGNGFVIEALFNYAHGNYDHILEMMRYEGSIFSLSDGGAHVGMICDASAPTFLLTHWARDRTRGERARIEEVIRRQTSDTANFYGLMDRGVLAPGYLADINVIDHKNLKLENPYLAFDLPAGGRRLLQQAKGYTATIKSGVVVSRNGEFTGALPGRLVRGPKARPN